MVRRELVVAAAVLLALATGLALLPDSAWPATLRPTYTLAEWPPPRPEGPTTDVLTIALRAVSGKGLTRPPDEIYVAQGTWGDLKRKGNRPPLPAREIDLQLVYLVWIKADFILNERGHEVPAGDYFVYYSVATGKHLFHYSMPKLLPGDQFNQIAWTRVTTQDIGKYPIPVKPTGEELEDWYARATAGAAQPTRTAVPAPDGRP